VSWEDAQDNDVWRLRIKEGWEAELTKVTGYIPRWFTCPQTVTHPSNPAVLGRESNSQTVDHESDALTTTPPSHMYMVHGEPDARTGHTFLHCIRVLFLPILCLLLHPALGFSYVLLFFNCLFIQWTVYVTVYVYAYTANASQYATSNYCKRLLFWFRCRRRYINVWTFNLLCRYNNLSCGTVSQSGSQTVLAVIAVIKSARTACCSRCNIDLHCIVCSVVFVSFSPSPGSQTMFCSVYRLPFGKPPARPLLISRLFLSDLLLLLFINSRFLADRTAARSVIDSCHDKVVFL